MAGKTASLTQGRINIDRTAPGITCNNAISDGTSFFWGSAPGAPTCASTQDGLSEAGCGVSGHGTAIGSHTLTATAADLAGNVSSERRADTVKGLRLSGFYSPVDMRGVWNSLKAGSTVPIKFEAFAAEELTSTSAVTSFAVRATSCPGATAKIGEIELTTAGTGLRYDATAGQFIQNWQTPKAPGSCYIATITTQDGTPVSPDFILKQRRRRTGRTPEGRGPFHLVLWADETKVTPSRRPSGPALQPCFRGWQNTDHMNGPARYPVGVICDDRPAMRTALRALLTRCGFSVALATGDVRVLQASLAALRPDVAVLALGACGTRGLTVLAALAAEDPECKVVLLSSFDSLQSAAAERGAHALVDEDDLRGLEQVLVAATSNRRPRGAQLVEPPADAPSRSALSPDGSAGTVTTKPSS